MKLLLTVVVGGYSLKGQITNSKVISEEVSVPDGVAPSHFIQHHTEVVRERTELLSDAQVRIVLSVAHSIIS